jgi:hypothetical protein
MARNNEKDGRKQDTERYISSNLSSFSFSLSPLSFILQVKEVRSMRERERKRERERERERERGGRGRGRGREEGEGERETKWSSLFALRNCIVFSVEA